MKYVEEFFSHFMKECKVYVASEVSCQIVYDAAENCVA